MVLRQSHQSFRAHAVENLLVCTLTKGLDIPCPLSDFEEIDKSMTFFVSLPVTIDPTGYSDPRFLAFEYDVQFSNHRSSISKTVIYLVYRTDHKINLLPEHQYCVCIFP